MKKLIYLIILSVMVLTQASVFPVHAAYDSSGNIFYLKTSDGLEDNIKVEGTITFKSQSGATIPGYRDCGVNFVPANEGEVIQITVNSIDLSDPNFLYLYDSHIEKIGYGTSSSGNQSGYLPDGWIHRFDKNTESGFTYTSTNETGCLGFGFHSGSAGNQTGFTLTVSSISLKDMEYVKTETFLPQAIPHVGEVKAPLMGVRVVTDGGSNPLTLNSLSLDCSSWAANQGFKVSDVRLYKGKNFDEANLLATAATPGDALSVSDLTLKTGNNDFYLVADIATDASGQIPIPAVSVTVAGESKTVNNLASPYEIDQSVWMQTGTAIYTIGENRNFYDDGGPAGKISEKFVGQVTFVPADEGKAVMIDFSKLEIFNTSSTGLNDVFTFYNGTEVKEENLIATLLKTPRQVKSTSPDGSLTVKLVSTTGVPANGWEAVVSQFTPTSMTLTSATAMPAEDLGNVSASTADVEMLAVKFTTENSLSPLTVENIVLSTTTPEKFSKIKVYAIDDSSEKPVRISVATVETPQASMNIPVGKDLKEGVNSFIITADIAADVLTADKVNLSVVSASVSGVENTLSAVAERTVENVWLSKEGTASLSLKGPWVYTHTPVASSTKYEAVKTDQIVTFVPATPGTVAELSFESFDVYYSSSSYGDKAIFEVYSGTGCSSDNLLWKLSSYEQSTTGPGKVLRSSSADGAMTIRFNPNTTVSYYTGNGWKANVREFANHAMTVIGSKATRPSTDVMAAGASAQRILDFCITTEGTLELKTLKEITLDLEGADAVSNIKVYAGISDDFSAASLFGENNTVAEKTVVGGNLTLSDGDNHFFVVIDIKEDAVPETAVRVGLAAIKDAKGNVDSFTNCNPEGSRIVKDMLISEAGTHVVTISRPKMWYDDGGAEGNMAKGITHTYTFVPAEDGFAVTLNAVSFALGSGSMKIYNGRTATEGNELGTITGYYGVNGPKDLTSKAADGSITVVTKTPSSSSLAGFGIELGLHQKVPYSLESIQTEKAVAETEIVRGASDIALVRIKATVAGDKDASEFSGFGFDLTGTDNIADIAALKLYYGGKSATFSPTNAQLLGTVAPENANVTFPDAKVSCGDNGAFYFYLVADFKSEAADGHKVAAALNGVAFNGNVFALESQTPVSVTLRAGLSGIYTVGGTGADYADFEAMAVALRLGIEGPVTFKIADGTYNANITIDNVHGTSAEHPLTITSQSANPDAVTISGKYSYSDNKGVLKVIATPYVTVRDLTFDAGSDSFENVLYVTDASHHVTFDNLTVKAASATGSSGINLVRTYTSTEEESNGRNNDFFTVTNSRFSGGFNALYLSSNGLVARVQDKGYVVRGNTVENAWSKAIYLVDIEGATVDANVVNISSVKKGAYYFDVYRAKGGVFSNNRFNIGSSSNTTDAYVLNFRQGCQGIEGNPIRVFNNELILQGSPSYAGRALVVDKSCKYLDIDHNTLRVSGTSAYVFATSGKGEPTGIRMRNNIFYTSCTGDAAYPLYFWNDTDPAAIQFSGNVFYSANNHLAKNDATIVDKEDIATLLGNSLNAWEQPQFLGETDSHLSQPLVFTTAAVSDVTVDREGNVRDASAPTPGAYEYAEVSKEAPVIQEGYPTVGSITTNSATVRSKWSLGGKLYALAVEWSDNAQAPSEEALLAATASDITAMTENSRTFSSLKEQTAYRVFMIAVSSAGVKSEVVATDVFETARKILPLEAIFVDDVVITDEVGKAVLEPLVEGGDLPYTYEWKDQLNQTVGNQATLEVQLTAPQLYTVSITSADGQSVSAKVGVEVPGVAAVAADFEDNYIPADSSTMPIEETGFFYSGTYKFNYGAWPEYDYWYGYTLSSEVSNEFTGLADQFRSAAGGAHKGNNFVIGYPEGLTIDVTNNPDGEVIPGFYVCNTAYAVNSMTSGDQFASPMTQGGWFLLKARVYKADGTSFDRDLTYLADYRSENQDDRFMVNDWKYVDLSQLGAIKRLTFLFDGSDRGSYGLNTPTYLAIDDFGAPKGLPTGIGSLSVSSDVRIYPSPVTERMFVETGLENYGIDIVSTNGALVYRSLGNNGNVMVERNGIAAGVYIVRVYNENASISRRIIVK